jgi:hypothetical protein
MRFSGYSSLPGSPGNLVAGGPSFDINRGAGALGGRSGEQLKRLYEGGTQQNEKLNEELMRRGIMPGSGPQLPQAFAPGFNMGALPGMPGNSAGIDLAQAQPGSFNLLNPFSWFRGEPQKVIKDSDRGIAPQQGSGSFAERMLRQKADFNRMREESR